MSRIIQLFFLIYFILSAVCSLGIEQADDWNTPRLIGKRYSSTFSYKGPQYLDTEWRDGTVYLSNGDSATHIFLKYNRYLDELIYFNKQTNSMVRLDKKPITGFRITIGNDVFYFKKLAFNRSSEKASFYEVLYRGRHIEFLVHRFSELSICPSYIGESGMKKDMEFKKVENYLISDNENGLLPIRLKKKSLVLKFGELKKKEIRKFLHQYHLSVNDEDSMVLALRLLTENGYYPVF